MGGTSIRLTSELQVFPATSILTTRGLDMDKSETFPRQSEPFLGRSEENGAGVFTWPLLS